ncbi:ATP synthase F1 subcomplex epsilon subunit [Pseudorhodobacter antarcticus]|jgi:F-type H+-transporting ATPase subunit epsilon|uniref:ATP synthase epsilon chain n=1 Tax=Pseudorhodobacter antarcticus TaxID=1077947 RepID=A0A1H8FXE2_9RHOB|nr:F0F1 ATP synthase subunit epsilon [Pseudorhodobacter antarcticus]SEN35907.1 ATP synthase F1 subcomplex epsilon subunit [Pseudorhodobacter antarcticus]
MAATLQFDLVSPEKRLASFQAVEVQIPGADGDMTAMEGHTPTITTLRPGILKAVGTDKTLAFAVTGGFAEITAAGVSVLAEQAVPVEDLSGTVLDGMIDQARELASMALPDDKDMAEKLVQDMMALRQHQAH